MKRFLTVLVAVILTLAMGIALIACDFSTNNDNGKDPNKPAPGEETDAPELDDLLGAIDFTKGLTATVDADVKVKVFGYDVEKDERTSEVDSMKINGTAKAKIDGTTFKADLELKMQASNPEMEVPAIANAYIRGDEVYSGIAFDKDGEVIYQNDSMADAGFNKMITALLPEYVKSLQSIPLYRVATHYITFKKSGDTYKADIDAVAVAGKLLDKAGDIIKDITVDTTVGDLYGKLGVKEILEAAYGDMTAKEMYEETLAQLKMLKDLDLDLDIPDLSVFPKTIDELINMANAELAKEEVDFTLPAAGNKTIVEYLDGIIAQFKDMTVGDIALILMAEGDEIPEEAREEALEAITTQLEGLKTAAPTLISTVKGMLALNTVKISLVADKDGHLTSVSVDVALDESLMDLIGGENNSDSEYKPGEDSEQEPGAQGSVSQGPTEPESTVAATADMSAQPDPFVSVKATIGLSYTATDFVDVTTLKTEAVKMAELAGEYELLNVSAIEYTEDGYVILGTVAIGGDFEGTTLTADIVALTLNADGTGSVAVAFGEVELELDVEWNLRYIRLNWDKYFEENPEMQGMIYFNYAEFDTAEGSDIIVEGSVMGNSALVRLVKVEVTE